MSPLNQEKSYIPHLKVQMCGIVAYGAQWRGYIFILWYIHLKFALLLYKAVLVNFPIATTVNLCHKWGWFFQFECGIWNLNLKINLIDTKRASDQRIWMAYIKKPIQERLSQYDSILFWHAYLNLIQKAKSHTWNQNR